MHGAFQAILSLDVSKICKLNHGVDALVDDAKALSEMQEALKRKGATYGDRLPQLVVASPASNFTEATELVNTLTDWATRRYEEREYKQTVHDNIQKVRRLLPDMMLWADMFSVQPAYENLLQKQHEAETQLDTIGLKQKEMGDALQREGEKLRMLLDEAKDAAQKVKVAGLQKVYQDRADAHRTTSSRWLIGTISGGVLLLVCATLPFLFELQTHLGFEKEQNHWLSTLIFAICLVPILAILGITNLCAKRASAHSHLAAVYEHKASIAEAFLWMSEAEKDDKLRAEWMRKIVEGLVSFESSGFLGKESGSGAPQPITMQVFKEAAELAKGGGNPPAQ
jgi:hypothetical protein